MTFEQPACQKCESPLISRLFCLSCNAFQTVPPEIDYFEVLGFPVCFEINSEDLEERYKRLSLVLHPDFFAAAPEEEKRLSEKASAMLNTAYSTLRELTSRAGYLLFLFTKEKNLNERTYQTGFCRKCFFCRNHLMNCLNQVIRLPLIK